MDATVLTLAIVGILALIVVGSFLIYRQRIEGEFELFGIKFKLKASNPTLPSAPGIKLGNVKAHQGGIVTENQVGSTIETGDLEAEKDVRTVLSQTENNPRPKA